MQIYFALSLEIAMFRAKIAHLLDPAIWTLYIRDWRGDFLEVKKMVTVHGTLKLEKRKMKGRQAAAPPRVLLGLPHARSTTTRTVAHHRTVASITTVIVGCCFPGLDFIIQPFLIKVTLKLSNFTLQP